jgi:hypothetical protein
LHQQGDTDVTDADFTRGLLRDARRAAKKLRVRVPKGLHAHINSNTTNPWCEVRDSAGNVLWEGTAADAFEARANAIHECMRRVASAGTQQ